MLIFEFQCLASVELVKKQKVQMGSKAEKWTQGGGVMSVLFRASTVQNIVSSS